MDVLEGPRKGGTCNPSRSDHWIVTSINSR